MVSMHDELVDSDTFLRVLEHEILPVMYPYPERKSVLMLDNAPVHNKPAIITLCQGARVMPIFFEPYSYDFNPIELVFHSAKHYLRNAWSSHDSEYPVKKNFEQALKNCIDGDIACNCFVHCHVNVTKDERDRSNNRYHY